MYGPAWLDITENWVSFLGLRATPPLPLLHGRVRWQRRESRANVSNIRIIPKRASPLATIAQALIPARVDHVMGQSEKSLGILAEGTGIGSADLLAESRPIRKLLLSGVYAQNLANSMGTLAAVH